MAKFVVTTVGRTVTIEADNFNFTGEDALSRETRGAGSLILYRTVPGSQGTQTVAVFRNWESVELRDDTGKVVAA